MIFSDVPKSFILNMELTKWTGLIFTWLHFCEAEAATEGVL